MFGNAEAYERFMGRWSRLVAPLLVEFTGLPDHCRVLDLGSGTASLSCVIAERNGQAKVVGVDPSQEYVAYAESKNPFLDRVSFQVGDAQQLPFPVASFDATLSLLAFNFIPDPKKALAEACRITKPGGTISAAVWDYGDGMRMLRTFWDAAKADSLDEKHMPLCRAGELSDLWKQGGLENVREEPLDITMQFQSFEDYWDPFLLGQGPAGRYAASLDPRQLQTLRRELERTLSLTQPARAWSVRGNVKK